MSLLERLQVHRQFIVFLLVGVLNTAFGYGVYAILIFVGLHYTRASALAIVLGVLFNFQTIRRLVFKAEHSYTRLVKFIGVYAVVYVLQIAGIAILKRFGLNDYAAGGMLVVPLAFVSFLLNKRMVFKD